MRKYLAGLLLSLVASSAFAQSVVTFDVKFTRVLEASGAFAPVLNEVAPGPFNPGPIPPPNLTGTVTISTVPSATQLASKPALNQIVLNGTWSTTSGFSPSTGWSDYTYNNAVFDLYSQDPTPSYTYTELIAPSSGDPAIWDVITGTAVDGLLSDHGPASLYGGVCPENGGFPGFGCFSANPFITFEEGTVVFDTGTSMPNFPTLADAGWHPLVSGSVSATNPSAGLNHDNGLDGFYMQTFLNTNTNTIDPGGVVRILMSSNTGNTWYVVEGTVVPIPAAAWLFASALGLLGWLRRRIA